MRIKRFNLVAAFNKWNIAENEIDDFCYCGSKTSYESCVSFFQKNVWSIESSMKKQ